MTKLFIVKTEKQRLQHDIDDSLSTIVALSHKFNAKKSAGASKKELSKLSHKITLLEKRRRNLIKRYNKMK